MNIALITFAALFSSVMGFPFQNSENSGLISSETVTAAQPVYLGEFNGKHFYIVRNKVNQATAKAACAARGYELARFETNEELNFVYDHTEPSDNYAWSGISAANVIFKYTDGTPIDPVGDGVDVGLTVERNPDQTTFLSKLSDEYGFYYCSASN